MEATSTSTIEAIKSASLASDLKKTQITTLLKIPLLKSKAQEKKREERGAHPSYKEAQSSD